MFVGVMGTARAAIKGQGMRIADLGHLEGPVLAFGGPYSNLQATRAMRALAQARGIGPDRCICTGDVVAYCADAADTVAEMRDWAVAVVAGNCEIQLAAGALDCGCGFEDGTVCDLLSAGWYAHANAQIGPKARTWMGTCPDIALFDMGGRRHAVIHGGLGDVARFLWPVSPEAAFLEEIARIEAAVGAIDVIVAGHSGIPFTRDIGAVRWINAGVIGMPPNDGGAQGRYALLYPDGRVAIERLDYDHQGARRAMEAAGLTQGYHLGLTTGLWPSEDVLPPAMRRGTGGAGQGGQLSALAKET